MAGTKKPQPVLGKVEPVNGSWTPATPAEQAVQAQLGHYIGISVPGIGDMGPLQLPSDHIYLEHYFTEFGARHVHSVSVSEFCRLFENALPGKGKDASGKDITALVHEHLVNDDPQDARGYHKYLLKWKNEGLI